MGAPRAPYPPDLAEDGAPDASVADALDARLEEVDAANERVLRSSLRRVELHLCRLTGIELAEATWTDVTLTDCRLDLAGFRYAKLERVAFRDCRLDESDFAGATLRDVLFERCSLTGASLAGAAAERIELAGCDLTGLQGVEALRGARMPWNDVLQNAPLFAQALGIEIPEDA